MRPSDDGGLFVVSIRDLRLHQMTSAEMVVEAMNSGDPFRYLMSLLAEADGKITLFADSWYHETKCVMEAFRALERHRGLQEMDLPETKQGDSNG